MYATHAREIAAFVAPGSDGWEDRAAAAYAAVAFTIRNLTPSVTSHVQAFLRSGMSAKTLTFPTRRMAVDAVYAGLHIAPLRDAHAQVLAGDHAAALVALCALPGLGYAKAGFLLQLVWGIAGCIDTRNEKAFKVKAPAWRAKAPRVSQLAHAAAYLRMCEELGGCERLWDAWCSGVSAQWPRRFASADTVSALHVAWVRDMHAALWRTAGVWRAYRDGALVGDHATLVAAERALERADAPGVGWPWRMDADGAGSRVQVGAVAYAVRRVLSA